MTNRSLVSPTRRPAPELLNRSLSPVLVVAGYVVIYVALSWVSFFQTLPGTCFSPWNPPPAASLALLVINGLRFAPALFVAAVSADVAVVGCPPFRPPAIIAMDAIIAIGYACVAVFLRRLAHACQGFPRVTDIVCLLLVAGVGSFAVAGLVACALVVMTALPPNLLLPSVWHFFIGDLTGIVGLLPALLTVRQAWARWKEVPPTVRAFDIGLFALGVTFALLMIFGMERSKELQFFYLLLLPVIWIGVRHGLAWCTMAILIEQLALIATIVIVGYPREDFLAYQIVSLAIAATGLVLGAVVTERQRTELYVRQQQAELYRAARLTTAGALGAAVIHEISQPLATLATYAHVCRRIMSARPTDFGLLDRTLAKAESETRRAGEIVERLRNFLSKSETKWSSIDLTDTTREVVVALGDMARSLCVSVRINTQPVPQVAADRVQIGQVMVNLIRNAIEAASESECAERFVLICLRSVDGEVEITVEDNGRGVRPELSEHLFTPFETSKQRGMGLGLSLSREIVRAHRGRLWWDSTAVIGARFVLRLPCDGIDRS
jgi:two-component system, LuxR family, sensor kinase FixL